MSKEVVVYAISFWGLKGFDALGSYEECGTELFPSQDAALERAGRLAMLRSGRVAVGYYNPDEFVPLWTRHGSRLRRVRANPVPTDKDLAEIAGAVRMCSVRAAVSRTCGLWCGSGYTLARDPARYTSVLARFASELMASRCEEQLRDAGWQVHQTGPVVRVVATSGGTWADVLGTQLDRTYQPAEEMTT